MPPHAASVVLDWEIPAGYSPGSPLVDSVSAVALTPQGDGAIEYDDGSEWSHGKPSIVLTLERLLSDVTAHLDGDTLSLLIVGQFEGEDTRWRYNIQRGSLPSTLSGRNQDDRMEGIHRTTGNTVRKTVGQTFRPEEVVAFLDVHDGSTRTLMVDYEVDHEDVNAGGLYRNASARICIAGHTVNPSYNAQRMRVFRVVAWDRALLPAERTEVIAWRMQEYPPLHNRGAYLGLGDNISSGTSFTKGGTTYLIAVNEATNRLQGFTCPEGQELAGAWVNAYPDFYDPGYSVRGVTARIEGGNVQILHDHRDLGHLEYVSCAGLDLNTAVHVQRIVTGVHGAWARHPEFVEGIGVMYDERHDSPTGRIGEIRMMLGTDLSNLAAPVTVIAPSGIAGTADETSAGAPAARIVGNVIECVYASFREDEQGQHAPHALMKATADVTDPLAWAKSPQHVLGTSMDVARMDCNSVHEPFFCNGQLMYGGFGTESPRINRILHAPVHTSEPPPPMVDVTVAAQGVTADTLSATPGSTLSVMVDGIQVHSESLVEGAPVTVDTGVF